MALVGDCARGHFNRRAGSTATAGRWSFTERRGMAEELEARMQQLERENAELRQRVGVVADTQQAVMKEAQSHGILSIEGGQPRLTTPDFFDLNKYASQGDFPGSLLIPGTKTSIQIGGYVQLDTIRDSDRTGNDDAFVVSSIPTGESKAGAGNTNFNIRQTRLFLKTQTPTSNWGDLVTYVEVDFMGTHRAIAGHSSCIRTGR